MLKFIVPCILLMVSVNSWWSIQCSLFILTFLFGFYIFHEFNVYLLSWCFMVDSLSSILILLSFWILALVVSASMKVLKDNNFPSSFLITNLFLLLFLLLTFGAADYLLFYISFEASLIPTLILILGWGYQPERIQAGIYMLFYTLFASLPLLLSLIVLYYSSGTLILNLVDSVSNYFFLDGCWYIITVFAFIVKLPMFLFHLWLPKAHVEAPVAGSMILAGVLLKLGGYGLIRVLPLFGEASKMFSWFWISISLVGSVIVSCMCLRQVDIKALIAYSSVAHMALVLCGLMTFGVWGISGAIVVMIGHGLCSSGLFCLANMVYERIGSRSLLISKGLINFMPTMALWWFLLSAGNMAAPPTLNLLGEISLIISIVSWSNVSMIFIALLSFFSAAYTLYLFSLSQHGKYYNAIFSCCSGKVREYLILMLHWFPLNLMIMKSSVMFIF
uniref:NADH-ubiquinone oxidoreductase chain 4 n=1 Tax=Acetes chinensis TaxID=439396 RepID=H9M5N1_9EUCA|nr:NADH dehydrogenase subunit 4 [Acetes chinensis]AEQ36598.1 NADH dehydrogenase subunit 4 [Acetes chinensis]